jgi:DNA-binding beta-propeller fold protein YncE
MRRILVAMLLLFTAATEPAMKQVGTIPLNGVEGRMDHFGADTQRGRLYLAALENNTLEVIDLSAQKRVRSIEGLKNPTGVRVLPESGRIVVASGGDGKVRVFDPDLKLLGAVDRLDDADNVRLDADGKLAYVGYGDGAIAVIDPNKPAKIGEIKLDGHPEAFALEATGPRIFVNVPSAKQIAVLDREKRAVIAKWPLPEAQANFPMALDEPHHRLFVACRKPAKVLVLDTETGKALSSADCCGDADDLFYDADTQRLYVTGGEGCITVLMSSDQNAMQVIGAVPTAPGARTSYFDPKSGRLYVAVPRRQGQAAELRVYQAQR